jgi:hypothetical protein
MAIDSGLLEHARLLSSRLERLSADSLWAHRASGVRGALLKLLESLERADLASKPAEAEQLHDLVNYGFRLLENAAKELTR